MSLRTKRELHLVHTLRNTKSENIGILRDAAGNSWQRLDNGDYLVQVDNDPEHEYVLPASSVKFERRVKVTAKSKGPGEK